MNDAIAAAVDKLSEYKNSHLYRLLVRKPQPNRSKNGSIQTRTKERRYPCDQCDLSFIQLDTLKEHKKVVHKEIRPSYVCDICNRQFTQYSSIKRHMITHTETNLYSCDICNKSYPNKESAIEHKITDHDVILLYTCDDCDKTFSRLCNLEMHKMIVHKEIRSNDEFTTVATEHEKVTPSQKGVYPSV